MIMPHNNSIHSQASSTVLKKLSPFPARTHIHLNLSFFQVNVTACLLACVGAAILTESPLTAIQVPPPPPLSFPSIKPEHQTLHPLLDSELTVLLTTLQLQIHPPPSLRQLLWVNLIMDSFASLALATEDPNASLLDVSVLLYFWFIIIILNHTIASLVPYTTGNRLDFSTLKFSLASSSES
jgi:hypothetical protein